VPSPGQRFPWTGAGPATAEATLGGRAGPPPRGHRTGGRAIAGVDATRHPRHSAVPGFGASATLRAMKPIYHPDDVAAMDPLVLMKNLDHVRMTSRRLSYILQQQVHLYTPQANQLREQIDTYVEAERQIEGEMARRQIRV